MKSFEPFAIPVALQERLRGKPRVWLVTGAAGFIGSHLVETLLSYGQIVRGLDNFSTGRRSNLSGEHIHAFGPDRFMLIEADLRDRAACAASVEGVDIVLHQAALGSVPGSIADPLSAHDSNVTGFINLLDAARLADVSRFVYASSSSIYGDSQTLPQVEERIGSPLSPYAGTKLFNEICATVYERSYGFRATGLRYFNVFGPRQDPDGAYAAVIPRWISALAEGRPITINGNGETSRDFTFVADAVQANLLAAVGGNDIPGQVFNVACQVQTSLNALHSLIVQGLAEHGIHNSQQPRHEDFRSGDIMHSFADISKARRVLGFTPLHDLRAGLELTIPSFLH